MNLIRVNDGLSKKKYRHLDDVRSHRSTTSDHSPLYAVGFIAFSLCFALLIITLWTTYQWPKRNTHVVILEARKSLSHKTSPRFLSYALDSSLLRNMKALPIRDKRFINLARYLSPAYVRIGGTSADCLFFNQTSSASPAKVTYSVNGEDISNFTITDKDFLALGEFATNAQARMIFDLNALIRKSDGSWDDANAKDIILFAKGHDFDVDWQIGNEPNSFPLVFNKTVSATQLAEDCIALRKFLDESGYEGSSILGPEVNHVGDQDHEGELYTKEFIEHAGNNIDYITWHQYYLNGFLAKLDDFINPATFDTLSASIKSMAKAINSTGKKISMWLSETSTAWGGGAPGLSDRFVAGFLWLDKLGYSATAGLNVVIRQSLFGGNYSLIAPDLTPNPDWWVSVVYKQFVSDRVLNLIHPDHVDTLRLYAQCTPEEALDGGEPAATIFGVNVDENENSITVQGVKQGGKILLYALTSDNLTSSTIQMNGETLKLQQNGDLPPFRPIIHEGYDVIVLPAYSMVFMILQGVDETICPT